MKDDFVPSHLMEVMKCIQESVDKLTDPESTPAQAREALASIVVWGEFYLTRTSLGTFSYAPTLPTSSK